MGKRLVVFIDWQNAYRGAREVFFSPGTAPHMRGQFHPLKLAAAIAARGDTHGRPYDLTEVRVYTGRPSSTHDPKSYSAHMKQCAGWTAAGVTVIPRSLRYPWSAPGQPIQKPMEKGIDVALAIDFVAYAIDGKYDVGLIMSNDTDLIPALEFVYSRFCTIGKCAIQVASWRDAGSKGDRNRSRLSIHGANVWCQWLERVDSQTAEDITNYAAP